MVYLEDVEGADWIARALSAESGFASNLHPQELSQVAMKQTTTLSATNRAAVALVRISFMLRQRQGFKV
jgi:hypothetical protein